MGRSISGAVNCVGVGRTGPDAFCRVEFNCFDRRDTRRGRFNNFLWPKLTNFCLIQLVLWGRGTSKNFEPRVTDTRAVAPDNPV